MRWSVAGKIWSIAVLEVCAKSHSPFSRKEAAIDDSNWKGVEPHIKPRLHSRKCHESA